MVADRPVALRRPSSASENEAMTPSFSCATTIRRPSSRKCRGDLPPLGTCWAGVSTPPSRSTSISAVGARPCEMAAEVFAPPAFGQGRALVDRFEIAVGHREKGERTRQLADQQRERARGVQQKMAWARARRGAIGYLRLAEPRAVEREAQDMVGAEIDCVEEAAVGAEADAMDVGGILAAFHRAGAAVLKPGGRLDR